MPAPAGRRTSADPTAAVSAHRSPWHTPARPAAGHRQYRASANSSPMHSGPPNSSACSINSRVTVASLPFSEAGPSSSRQATIIGRWRRDTHQADQAVVVAQAAAVDGVDLAPDQLALEERRDARPSGSRARPRPPPVGRRRGGYRDGRVALRLAGSYHWADLAASRRCGPLCRGDGGTSTSRFDATRVLPWRRRDLRTYGTSNRGSAPEPASQPVPGLGLHLGVELVRRVVEPAAELLGDARLRVAGGELVEARPDPVEVEQAVLACR